MIQKQNIEVIIQSIKKTQQMLENPEFIQFFNSINMIQEEKIESDINWHTGEMPKEEGIVILGKFQNQHRLVSFNFGLIEWNESKKEYVCTGRNNINPTAWAVVDKLY